MIPLLNTYKELDKWAGKIRNMYRDRNLESGYNPSHELQNITYDIETNMGVFTMVFHVPDYFKWAENGRGPGKMPPPGSLIEWMEWKQILPSPMQLSNGKTVLPSMQSLEFLIRRSIGEHGTEGSHNWENLMEDIRSQLTEAIKKALEKDFREYIQGIGGTGKKR